MNKCIASGLCLFLFTYCITLAINLRDTELDGGSVSLPSGKTVTATDRISIHVNRQREFHGPSLVRCPNGDLLLFHQNSVEHVGLNGFVEQFRSQDDGLTWSSEGSIADWGDDHIDALFGEAVATEDGRLVMFVQRRLENTGDEGILSSWLMESCDNGKTWKRVGPVDKGYPEAVMMARSFQTIDDRIYVATWSSTIGSALYASPSNDGLNWSKVSNVFPKSATQAHYDESIRFAPFYPNVAFLGDGKAIAVSYSIPPVNSLWRRTSEDGGLTWSAVESIPGFENLWAPRLKVLNSGILMISGRDYVERKTVVYVSEDFGATWSERLTLDKVEYEGWSYAYTDFIELNDSTVILVTSTIMQLSDREDGTGKGDIIGFVIKIK